MKLYVFLMYLHLFSYTVLLYAMNEKTPLLQPTPTMVSTQEKKLILTNINRKIKIIYRIIGQSTTYPINKKKELIKQLFDQENVLISKEDKTDLISLYRLLACKTYEENITIHALIYFNNKTSSLLHIAAVMKLKQFLSAIDPTIIDNEIKRLEKTIQYFKENYLLIDTQNNTFKSPPPHHLEPIIKLLKQYIKDGHEKKS